VINQGTGNNMFSVSGSIENRIYKGRFSTYHVDTNIGRIIVKTEKEKFSIGDKVDVVGNWSQTGMYIFTDI